MLTYDETRVTDSITVYI